MEPTDKQVNDLVIASGNALSRDKARQVLIEQAKEAAVNAEAETADKKADKKAK